MFEKVLGSYFLLLFLSFADGQEEVNYGMDNQIDVQNWANRSTTGLSAVHYWSKSAVVYSVNESIGCPMSFHCQQLINVMKEFQTKTCIRFQQWTGQPHQVHITKLGHNCSSDFGVRKDLSVQYLILGDTCWSEEKLIYHMGRILGLQRRPAKMRLLEQWTQRSPNSRLFDTGSSDGSGGLDQVDAVRAGRIYNCSSGTEPRKGFPSNMTCHFSSHMCGFTSKGELQWELYPTGGVAYTSKKEGAEEHSGSLISPVFHGRNLKNKGNGTGCIEFSYMTQGYGIYNIKVLQRLLSSPLQILDLDTTPVILQWHSGDLVHPAPSKDNDYIYVSSKLSTDSPFTVEIEFTTAWGVIALDDLIISYTPCQEKPMRDV